MSPDLARPASTGIFSRLRGRSLRFQILVVMLTLLTLSFLAVGAVTALALRTFLIDRLDQQLVAADSRFTGSLEQPNDHDADNSAQFTVVQGQAAGTLGAQIVHGSVIAVDVVARENSGDAVTARDRQVIASLTPGHGARTIQLPELGDYRVLVSPGDDQEVLVTGLPEHPVDETIGRLLLIEASVFAAALILSGIVAELSVRWSLRPLNRVALTAREVANRPLSTGTVTLPERVTVTAPGTEAGQVAAAFNHMLEHVESALHARHTSEDKLRRFIADASHELRTPIAVVRSHAEYAQRVGGQLPGPVSEALARIGAESDRMGHLVEDLLLLARLDSGRQLEREPLDLTRLVLEAVSDARVTGKDHHWRLDLPEQELMVSGDAHALHQVVANLLANARTHTPAGTTVSTTVGEANDPARVVVTVADDGPGIPAGILPRVFDRFVRADAARARHDGSGLGLSITSAIVGAHHGTVSATSHDDTTTFVIELPRLMGDPAGEADG